MFWGKKALRFIWQLSGKYLMPVSNQRTNGCQLTSSLESGGFTQEKPRRITYSWLLEYYLLCSQTTL